MFISEIVLLLLLVHYKILLLLLLLLLPLLLLLVCVCRDALVGRWCAGVREAGLEVSDGFSLVGTLTPALHTRAWGLEGLPTDSFSLQNGTIIKHTNK